MKNWIILVSALILVSGCAETGPLLEEEKGLIYVVTLGHFYDPEQEDSAWFSVDIANFGYVEAKNVEVRCVLYDEDYNIVTSITKDVGNIASISFIGKDIVFDLPNNYETGVFSSYCYATKCKDNCESLLYRIPDQVEAIEGLE